MIHIMKVFNCLYDVFCWLTDKQTYESMPEDFKSKFKYVDLLNARQFLFSSTEVINDSIADFKDYE